MNDIPIFHYDIRVYAEDVDFMGIMYHANYLFYYERARTEMLRAQNLLLTDLNKQNVLFAIKELTIQYIAPAKLDDLLTITAEIVEIRACSLVFNQHINNQQGKRISEAKVQVVCVNGDLKPKRLPHLF